MKITIRKPGLLTTIQDLGRPGYLSQAVPVSGAMDTLSARLANKALGNPDDCAVIEFTHSGAEFITDGDVLVALSGDGAWLNAGDQNLPSDKPVFIPANSVIQLQHNKSGSRSYLAVAGGWDIPEVLGSRSTYLTAKMGGLNGRCLLENDYLTGSSQLSPTTQLILNSLTGKNTTYPNWSVARDLFLPADRKTIRVIPAKEFNWFDGASVNNFLSQPYIIDMNSNRMGYRLHGVPMNRVITRELLSTAVSPGTIQVTGDGSLVLLMADCQTTGGYPRIAQVAAVDLPLCAQLKPGDGIHFADVSWREAELLYIRQEEDLRKLSAAIALRY